MIDITNIMHHVLQWKTFACDFLIEKVPVFKVTLIITKLSDPYTKLGAMSLNQVWADDLIMWLIQKSFFLSFWGTSEDYSLVSMIGFSVDLFAV